MDGSIVLEAGPKSGRPGSIKRRNMAKGVARHTLGLLMLSGVIFLWTASNFLSSSIFADSTYAKPFFMTLLNSTVLISAAIPRLIATIFARYKDGTLSERTRQSLAASRSDVSAKQRTDKISEESPLLPSIITPSSHRSTHAQAPSSSPHEINEYLDFKLTLYLALRFFPLWFFANYFASACLQFAAVASATILTSTASIWTLIVGVATGIEKFTWTKLGGVLATFCGIVLISHVDLSTAGAAIPSLLQPTSALDEFPDKTMTETVIGDAMALFSAVVYGFYSISLKRATTPNPTTKPTDLSASISSLLRLPDPVATLHMPTFFGLVGLLSTLFLAPLLPVFHYTGIETFALPPTRHVWLILLSNSLSSILSDVLWAYALVLTSPLVVTVGLSMTIPLSLVGEMVLQGRYEGWIYWVGAMIVLAGFVGIEREEREEERVAEQEADDEEGSSIVDELEEGGGGGGGERSSRSKGLGAVAVEVSKVTDGDGEDDTTRDRLYRQPR